MPKHAVKKKPVRLRAGWRHDWYEPVPADHIVIREIVPGPFNSPQIVESSPFVLLSSDHNRQLRRPSQLRLPAELRAGRRCANLRTGIPDPWAEYLTFRGVPMTRSKVNPQDAELWSRQLDLTERAWKHFGICMNQGIPDPWKNWPKAKTWQGVGSAKQKKPKTSPMGQSDIDRRLPAEPEPTASCRHEIKQSKSAPDGLSACCPCSVQIIKPQISEIKNEIPLSMSPINLCKCPETEQVVPPLTLELPPEPTKLPPEPSCVCIAQLEENIKPDVKKSIPCNVDDTFQERCESKLMIICHPKSSICIRQENKARKALKESKSKIKAASPSCLCKPIVVKSEKRKCEKEENYCTNEKNVVSCPCQDTVSSSQKNEMEHANDPNAYICICSGNETKPTKTKTTSKHHETNMSCNWNRIKTKNFRNQEMICSCCCEKTGTQQTLVSESKQNKKICQSTKYHPFRTKNNVFLENHIVKASPVIKTCTCGQSKSLIKVQLKSSKSEERDRIAYYELVTGRNSNIKLNSSNNRNENLTSNREFSFVLEENIGSKNHNETEKRTNAKRMSVTEKNRKQEIESALVNPQRLCTCSQDNSQCKREKPLSANKKHNYNKCGCQNNATESITAPIVNTQETFQHDMLINEERSFANNVSDNENVQIEMPDLPLVENILSSKKSPSNNNHQNVTEERTVDNSKNVKTVEIPVSWLSESSDEQGDAGTDAASSSNCSVTSQTIIDKMKVLQGPVKSEEKKKLSSSDSERTTIEVNKNVVIGNDALPTVYSSLYLFPNSPANELGIISELEESVNGELAKNGQPSEELSSPSSEVRKPRISSQLDASSSALPYRVYSSSLYLFPNVPSTEPGISSEIVNNATGDLSKNGQHSVESSSPSNSDVRKPSRSSQLDARATRNPPQESQSADSMSSSNGSTTTLRASPQHSDSATRRQSMISQCAEELTAMLALRELSRQSGLNTPAIKKLSITTSPKPDDDTTATSSSSTTVDDSKPDVEYNASFIRLARSKRSQSTSRSDVLTSIKTEQPVNSKPQLELLRKPSHLIKTEKLDDDNDHDDDDSVVSHMTTGTQTQGNRHKIVKKGGNASVGLSPHRSKTTMKTLQGATCNRKPNSNSPRSTCCECKDTRCTRTHLSRGTLTSVHPTRMEVASAHTKQLGNTCVNMDRHKFCFVRDENEWDVRASQLSRAKMSRNYPVSPEECSGKRKTKQNSGLLVIERGRIFPNCHNQISENGVLNIRKDIPEFARKQCHSQSVKTSKANALLHYPHGKHTERDWKVRESSDTGSGVEPLILKHKSKKKEKSSSTRCRQFGPDVDRGWKDELSTDAEPRVDHVSPKPRCKSKCARSKHVDTLKKLHETAIERSWKGLPSDVAARVETVRTCKSGKTRNCHQANQHTK